MDVTHSDRGRASADTPLPRCRARTLTWVQSGARAVAAHSHRVRRGAVLFAAGSLAAMRMGLRSGRSERALQLLSNMALGTQVWAGRPG